MILQQVADTHLLTDVIAFATVIVTVTGFAYNIRNIAKGAVDSLAVVANSIKDHETRLRVQEKKVTILWDGHERRGQGRRSTDLHTDEYEGENGG